MVALFIIRSRSLLYDALRGQYPIQDMQNVIVRAYWVMTHEYLEIHTFKYLKQNSFIFVNALLLLSCSSILIVNRFLKKKLVHWIHIREVVQKWVKCKKKINKAKWLIWSVKIVKVNCGVYFYNCPNSPLSYFFIR